MAKILISFIVLGLLSGCQSLMVKRDMAGEIGCHKDEIIILSSDSGHGLASTTYHVACHDENFICSQNLNNDMNCAKMAYKEPPEVPLEKARDESFDNFIDDLNNRSSSESTKKSTTL